MIRGVAKHLGSKLAMQGFQECQEPPILNPDCDPDADADTEIIGGTGILYFAFCIARAGELETWNLKPETASRPGGGNLKLETWNLKLL